ncbi:MAG: hypothetical protein CMO40_08455 [Verrucomicrobiaceae bacterium]|nr:hypothetical protein [Verrucomicrobiaceae bacterium]
MFLNSTEWQSSVPGVRGRGCKRREEDENGAGWKKEGVQEWNNTASCHPAGCLGMRERMKGMKSSIFQGESG